MPIGYIFWTLMLLWFVFSLYWGWRTDRAGGFVSFAPVGGNFIVFILLFLLGWKSFGFVVSG